MKRTYENNIGSRNPNALLTEEKVIQIRKMRAAGLSRKEIADYFDLSRSTVQKAYTGITWKHVVGGDK